VDRLTDEQLAVLVRAVKQELRRRTRITSGALSELLEVSRS
jgi:hypothetical protein